MTRWPIQWKVSYEVINALNKSQPPWTTPYYTNTKTAFNSASSPLSSIAKLVHQRTYTKESETMDFEKEYLDVVLVPTGLLIMFIYHLFLLYKYFHQPLSTTMGYENNDKIGWQKFCRYIIISCILFPNSGSWWTCWRNLINSLLGAGWGCQQTQVQPWP